MSGSALIMVISLAAGLAVADFEVSLADWTLLGEARSGVEAALEDEASAPAGRPIMLIPKDSEWLKRRFAERGYELEAVRAGRRPVPALMVRHLPGDLDEIRDVQARKSLFIRALLPLVMAENAQLRRQRERLMRIRATDGPREADDQGWLDRMMARYGADGLEALARRLDIVPPSLAIAQGAIESGWGRSRFALKGNALYGQWTWDEEDPGLVPEARRKGARHRIRAFDSLAESVRGYMHNLNTHSAYAELRARRADLRAQDKPVTGPALAPTLTRYSERGAAYVADLRTLMRQNDLPALDRARPAEALARAHAPPDAP